MGLGQSLVKGRYVAKGGVKDQDVERAWIEGQMARIALPELQVGDSIGKTPGGREKERRGIHTEDLAIAAELSQSTRHGAGSTAHLQQHRSRVKCNFGLVAHAHGDLLRIGSPQFQDTSQILQRVSVGSGDVSVYIRHELHVS
jgi:hypothetical protein